MRDPIHGEDLYHPADDGDLGDADACSTGLLELEDDGAGAAWPTDPDAAGEPLGDVLDLDEATAPFVLVPGDGDEEGPDTEREPAHAGHLFALACEIVEAHGYVVMPRSTGELAAQVYEPARGAA